MCSSSWPISVGTAALCGCRTGNRACRRERSHAPCRRCRTCMRTLAGTHHHALRGHRRDPRPRAATGPDRDHHLGHHERAILDAVISLLAEVGYEALTIDGVIDSVVAANARRTIHQRASPQVSSAFGPVRSQTSMSVSAAPPCAPGRSAAASGSPQGLDGGRAPWIPRSSRAAW
jgi:hypothetical protein